MIRNYPCQCLFTDLGHVDMDRLAIYQRTIRGSEVVGDCQVIF